MSNKCDALLGRKIKTEKTATFRDDNKEEEKHADKHFTVDDLALKRFIFRNETGYLEHLSQVSDEYRFFLKMPDGASKDKEVNLTLYNNRIVIRQRVK